MKEDMKDGFRIVNRLAKCLEQLYRHYCTMLPSDLHELFLEEYAAETEYFVQRMQDLFLKYSRS